MYVLPTNKFKYLIDSNIHRSTPFIPSYYIILSSITVLLVLYYLPYNKIPLTILCLLDTVYAHVPSGCGICWTFLDAYWILIHDNIDNQLLDASQQKNMLSQEDVHNQHRQAGLPLMTHHHYIYRPRYVTFTQLFPSQISHHFYHTNGLHR